MNNTTSAKSNTTAGASSSTPNTKRSPTASLKEITQRAMSELHDLTGFEASSVVSIKKDESEWRVLIELIEKKGIPDRMDIIGLYEAKMSMTGDLAGYERRGLRKRGDTMQETEEEVA